MAAQLNLLEQVPPMLSNLSEEMPSDVIVYSLKKTLRYKEICREVLQQELINQIAQEYAIAVEPDEIQIEADYQRRKLRLERASDTFVWLANQRVTPEEWEAGIHDQILVNKLSKALFDSEIARFFAENRLDFDQVLLYQIVVPYSQIAQELFYQIEESEISFFDAAHLYDIDSGRRRRCGYEGFVHRWNLLPAIAVAVFSAIPGQLLSPIQTEQGFHLLLAEEVTPAELTPETQQIIRDRLFKEWLESELTARLQ